MALNALLWGKKMSWYTKIRFSLVDPVSAQYKLPENLLAAIIMKESSWNDNVVRYEPHYAWVCDVKGFAKRLNASEATEQMLQMTSWGLCQVMGSVAREYNFQGWLTDLLKPEVNVKIGAQHLKAYLARYPAGITDAISAYNQGSPRKDPKGKYLNQDYVDTVLSYQADIAKTKKALGA